MNTNLIIIAAAAGLIYYLTTRTPPPPAVATTPVAATPPPTIAVGEFNPGGHGGVDPQTFDEPQLYNSQSWMASPFDDPWFTGGGNPTYSQQYPKAPGVIHVNEFGGGDEEIQWIDGWGYDNPYSA